MANLKMASRMEKVNIIMLIMEVSNMKVHLKMVSIMELENFMVDIKIDIENMENFMVDIKDI